MGFFIAEQGVSVTVLLLTNNPNRIDDCFFVTFKHEGMLWKKVLIVKVAQSDPLTHPAKKTDQVASEIKDVR